MGPLALSAFSASSSQSQRAALHAATELGSVVATPGGEAWLSPVPKEPPRSVLWTQELIESHLLVTNDRAARSDGDTWLPKEEGSRSGSCKCP